MAFFGLQWVPQLDAQVRASEADPVELIELAHHIRITGYNAAREQAAKMSEIYAHEYHQFPQKKQEMQAWKDYINSRLTTFSAKEAERVQNAAFAWKNLDPNYHVYNDGLSENGKALVEEYYQFLAAKDIYDDAEQALWTLSTASTNAQRVADLWAFEAQNAENQQKKLKQELKIEKRRRADLRKANDLYIRKMQRSNKEKSKRTGGHRSSGTTSHDRPRKGPDNEDLDLVLSGLGKIALRPEQKSPDKDTKKSSNKGILDSWFGPTVIPEKDFL